MTPEERINHLRGFVLSPVWLEIIEPTYRARLQAEMNALVASEAGEEMTRGALGVLQWAIHLPHELQRKRQNQQRRGRIKALQALLTWPAAEVMQDVEDQRRESERSTDEAARWAHLAEYGFHSPVPLPEPSAPENP